jgi:hypothetical protein
MANSLMQHLKTIETLEDRIVFVNNLHVWTCYELFSGHGHQQDLEDLGVIYHIAYNLMQHFLEGGINIKKHINEWKYVNELYNNIIYKILDKI